MAALYYNVMLEVRYTGDKPSQALIICFEGIISLIRVIIFVSEV